MSRVEVGETREAPKPSETFLADLRRWSLLETGSEDGLRASWSPKLGLHTIERRLAGDVWNPILLVVDYENATQENLRPYRILDRRVFEDLVEASLARKFNTGNPGKDFQLYRKYKSEIRELAQTARRKNTMDEIWGINEESKPLFHRIAAEMEQGHSHGTKMVHQVPEMPG